MNFEKEKSKTSAKRNNLQLAKVACLRATLTRQAMSNETVPQWVQDNHIYQKSNAKVASGELAVVAIAWVFGIYLFIRHGLFRTLLVDNSFSLARRVSRLSITLWVM
jgi:hypothetical protein